MSLGNGFQRQICFIFYREVDIMAGINGISAYQQTNQSWKTRSQKAGSDDVKTNAQSKAQQGNSAKENSALAIKNKLWSPIAEGSSLVPKTTEYGTTIGDVKLSDTAKDYLNSLKAKYGNMEFIVVSKDMKEQVKQNASAYGNANKTVVLIDDEKLERMATDESFRKKYEGIISMAQYQLENAKNALTSSGANVKSFGMSVDDKGNQSFFATVEKSQDLQKERIEKKAEAKREEKAKAKKKAAKEANEERIENARNKKKADKVEKEDKADRIETEDVKEYVTIEAKSFDELISKVQKYTYDNVASNVRTEAERMLGTQVDYVG